ncbi:hypothetical protein COY62_03575 [bacterium (Candidatus Howlettbacteria) CG_4_10_14_0_8_um_filter_40_9]|nr:MAG: hypothetical protein COY62_03575 [bacterium (Candidatus Howlettbacteria) CG_4_10_14_0_8_um_filter_40_9]
MSEVLKTDKDLAIVAFRENTSFVHYFPEKESSKKLEPESLILVDIWARLIEKNSPYADITWMAYYGKTVPREMKKVFEVVANTRDACLDFIKDYLSRGGTPSVGAIEKYHSDLITKSGYGEGIDHLVGHSIGFDSPHGKYPSMHVKNKEPILKNIGYTIEPGIYLKNRFGVRSEIDFYIDDNNGVMVTTEVQDKIVRIYV